MTLLSMLAMPTLCAMGSQRTMLPIPPPMPRRAISRRSEPYPGETSTLAVEGQEWTLFVPSVWRPTERIDLAVHFHGAVWHAIQEHLDRGLVDPLLAFYPGEGSGVYQRSVANPAHFGKLLEAVRGRLALKGMGANAKFGAVDVTSFSAGYGAVREWVRQPEPFRRLRRVILADSLYGSLEPTVAGRVPARESIEAWKPLVTAAMSDEKEFVVTVSEVATPTYASSWECADALVRMAGGGWTSVEPGTLAATLDSDFPLRARFDRKRLHIWAYGGSDAQAHMTHARHFADVWKALDLSDGKR